MLAPPPVEFAVRNGTHIAYQAAGSGPAQIVFVAGSIATTLAWDEHETARSFRRLANFSRLVTYDQWGLGLSDRFDQSIAPTLEDLVADLGAVIEAAGITDPILFGSHNGGAVAVAYATAHPVRRLILCNTWARLARADDFPIGFRTEVLDRLEERYRTEWGEGKIFNDFTSRQDARLPRKEELSSTSQNLLMTLFRMNREYDIRHLLPLITVPTLVIHLEDNVMVPPRHGKFIADAIPGARFALLPGADHGFLRNHGGPVIDEVEKFVTGSVTPFSDRINTTMLFTDIVDSTPLAASLGNEAWSALIDEHNRRTLRQIDVHGGHEVKSTGDGFLIAFDDATSAIRCALGSMDVMSDLGLELRAGVHFGEVSRMGKSDLSGLAVHFAQRLCGLAPGGVVLTSDATRQACQGSDIIFDVEGTHILKGIPGEWEIFRASL
jgi:class 3 adenylate cyclase/alpha-beta hydrolase superfamily lysophospholipase